MSELRSESEIGKIPLTLDESGSGQERRPGI